MQGYTGPESVGREPRAFGDRLIGALRLDASVYEEVEHDREALGQAAGVIALAAVAQGIGMAGSGVPGLVAGIIGGLLGWLVSASVIWLVGVRLMGCTSDFPELLRTLGFASAPQVLYVVGVIPLGPLRPFLALAVGILTLVAYVIAVRQALDVGTGQAVLVCLLGVAMSIFLTLLLVATLIGAAALVGTPT
jgi:hypothetical protein